MENRFNHFILYGLVSFFIFSSSGNEICGLLYILSRVADYPRSEINMHALFITKLSQQRFYL